MKSIIVVLSSCGHENIRATHGTTFEITKDTNLTERGDCIIAVAATKGAVDLPFEFRKTATKQDAQITITIEAGELVETIKAEGSPQLSLAHPTDLVVRKTDYICDRTLAIKADKAARDFSRKLIKKIQDSSQEITITIAAETY